MSVLVILLLVASQNFFKFEQKKKKKYKNSNWVFCNWDGRADDNSGLSFRCLRFFVRKQIRRGKKRKKNTILLNLINPHIQLGSGQSSYFHQVSYFEKGVKQKTTKQK